MSQKQSPSHFEKFATNKLQNTKKLLTGTPIYGFKEFYDAKNLILKYDHRRDYLNYGYWPEGEATPNPSASLVAYLAGALHLRPQDVLLNIGSGLGQPDVDMMSLFPVKRIIGINKLRDQVEYANQKYEKLGLSSSIRHYVVDAREIPRELTENVSAVISIEVFAEIEKIEGVFQQIYQILPPGGRFCFCDIVKTRNDKLSTNAMFWFGLAKTTEMLYGDQWRSIQFYQNLLEKTGFRAMRSEKLGRQVYPLTFQYAKERMSLLWQNPEFPLATGLLAYLNLKGLDLLFSKNEIEYVMFYAEK